MQGKPINYINEWVIDVRNWGSVLLGTSEKPCRTFFIIVPLEDREAIMFIFPLSFPSNTEKHRFLHCGYQITDYMVFFPLVSHNTSDSGSTEPHPDEHGTLERMGTCQVPT